MKVSVEISLYPLNSNYKIVILNFIKQLKAYSEVETYTTEMSTYIKGDWSDVMRILEEELGAIYKIENASSTIIKIIPQDLPIENGFRSQ